VDLLTDAGEEAAKKENVAMMMIMVHSPCRLTQTHKRRHARHHDDQQNKEYVEEDLRPASHALWLWSSKGLRSCAVAAAWCSLAHNKN
jgi:hypothetical protein